MKFKYLLDAAIYYYCKYTKPKILSITYVSDSNFIKFKTIFDSFPSKIYKDEYDPEDECIKCSVILTRVDDDDKYEELMLEKYLIYNLEDFIDLEFLRLQYSLCYSPL